MSDAKQIRLGWLTQISGVNPSLSTIAFNATNIAVEWVFQSKTNQPITTLYYKQNGLTGAPGTIRLSLQGVDSSGNPDGVIKSSGNAFATKSLAAGDNGNVVAVALGSSYTPSLGEDIAQVMDFSSGTFDASNLLTLALQASGMVSKGFPYVTVNNAGSRTRQTGVPVFGYATASQMYGYPIKGFTAPSFGSGNNPNEYALKFTIPAAWTGTYSLLGVEMGAALAASQTLTIKLYSGGNAGDTTVLASDTHNTSLATSTGARAHEFVLPNISAVTLTAGSTYRLSVVPGATSQTFYYASVQNAADWAAMEGGTSLSYSTRNGGNWTDTDTNRMLFQLIFQDLSVSAGGIAIPPPPLIARGVAQNW